MLAFEPSLPTDARELTKSAKEEVMQMEDPT